MSTATDPKREILRHTVAVLAYRAGKTLRAAPARFAAFRAGARRKLSYNIFCLPEAILCSLKSPWFVLACLPA